jgi:hypothetical protein
VGAKISNDDLIAEGLIGANSFLVTIARPDIIAGLPERKLSRL